MQNQNFIFRSFVCTAVLVVLSVMAVKSWGACAYVRGNCGVQENTGSYACLYQTNVSCGSGTGSSYFTPCNSTYPELVSLGSKIDQVWGGGNVCYARADNYCCQTQAEVDSLRCSEICHAPDYCLNGVCVPGQRDSLVVCENATQVEDGPIYTQMLLFKCEKADNSQGYDDDKCRLMMNVPGTCGQNGYESGVQPSDSIAPGVDCFASFDNTCYMMDKPTRNTFACGCDNNSCYLAKLAVASGDCKNPYASSSPSSSGSSSPSSASSASSSGSSSPSSSEGRPDENISSPATESGSSGDWEYDYSGILNAINNNVIYVGNGVQAVNSSVQALNGSMERLNGTAGAIRANTQGIISNTGYTNTLINQKIVPAINSASSAITGKLDQVHGEWSGLWNDFTTSTSTDFDYSDTIDYYEPDYSDEIKDTSVLNLRDTIMAHKRSLDSVIAYVDSVRNDTTTNYVALDSIYDWSDTNQIKQKLSDFFIPNVSTLQSCPVIDYTIDWPSPIGSQRWYIPFGNLYGRFDLCDICRQIVKFLTLIIISLNSIKSIIRAFSSGGT